MTLLSAQKNNNFVEIVMSFSHLKNEVVRFSASLCLMHLASLKFIKYFFFNKANYGLIRAKFE